MAGSSEQELAIRIAGKVENSLKQSLGMTEDGISHLAGMAKKAAVMITGAFAAIKVGQFIGDAVRVLPVLLQVNMKSCQKPQEMQEKLQPSPPQKQQMPLVIWLLQAGMLRPVRKHSHLF